MARYQVVIETRAQELGGFRASVAHGGPDWSRNWSSSAIEREDAFKHLSASLRSCLGKHTVEFLHSPA